MRELMSDLERAELAELEELEELGELEEREVERLRILRAMRPWCCLGEGVRPTPGCAFFCGAINRGEDPWTPRS